MTGLQRVWVSTLADAEPGQEGAGKVVMVEAVVEVRRRGEDDVGQCKVVQVTFKF
jgi:hypothetical protein